ncbi:unnamed protein product [Malus baccata var. baccata]
MDTTDTEETVTVSGSDWAELTQECLINILGRLTLKHRWSGPMLVCKPWLQVCKDPCLNSAFDLEPVFDTGSHSQLNPPFKDAQWWTPEFERRVDSMLRSVVDWSAGSLKQIRTRHCSNQSLSHVAQGCPSLEVLSIKSCPNVTDSSMADIAVGCPMIRELDISYCHEVSHESLVLIGRNCQNLKILKRNMLHWLDPFEDTGLVPDEYPWDGNSEAAAIGKSMPNLEHLELRFSTVSAKGFTLISVGCPNLEYLDLFGCVNLTSRDIENTTSNLKNLKEIKMPR